MREIVNFRKLAKMPVEKRARTALLLVMLVLPASAGAQTATTNLSAPVPKPGESSSVTTIEGGEKTTTLCRTDTVNNTVCVNRSYQIAPVPNSPAPLPPTAKEEVERQSAARERSWEAYCKPTPYVGRDGLTRYRYAHANCDMVVLSRTTPRPPWAAAQ